MNVPVQPIDAAPFFAPVYAAHVRLLQSLTPEHWALPTVCAGWSVKDVALHMLADDVGWLSARRDQFHQPPDRPIHGWEDLVALIDARNAIWVEATRRMSTRLLCDLVPILGSMMVDFIATLDPNEPGVPVSWAGDAPAPRWLEIGRELTERWLHHQHICDAVGVTSLKDADLVHTVLDTFVRALPHTYRAVLAPAGTTVTLTISGTGGGEWSLVREDKMWKLYSAIDMLPDSAVTLPVEVAWRLFTKGITPAQARQQTLVGGDAALAEPLFYTVSIMA